MCRWTDDDPAFFSDKCKKPYGIPHFIDVFSTTGIGLATLALVGSIFLPKALAQMPQTQTQIPRSEETSSEANVLFVNPSGGNDTAGNGGENAPFKTITQALRVAQANTVIVLAPGTYSAESGESFPLMLKPGVSIQGDASNKGKEIIIQGGGSFISPTFASQNVAVVGANQAALTGVTVTNPNPRGYGLWIESSNPLVVDNTFTGNTHDGISVNGNAAPSIRKNYFYENGANGITIYGSSRPEVRENVFEKTGFGVNIAQNAAPTVVDNRIIQNRTGVIVQAKARPLLRNNLIEGSSEDGLVALADAQPNLGTASEPGSNTFRNNARYDINAQKAQQTFPAFGNTLEQESSVGKIDFAGTVAITPPPPLQNNREESPRIAAIQQVRPRPPATSNENQPRDRQSQRQSQDNTEAFPTPSSLSGESAQMPPERETFSVVEIPVPLPENASGQSLTFSGAQINSTPEAVGGNGDESTLEFTAPQASTEDDAPSASRNSRRSRNPLPPLEAAPEGDSALLPVPDANIPVGNPGRRTTARSTRTRSAGNTARGAVRVVVEVTNESEQARVRSLVPEAFRTVENGRVLMQLGVFSNRNNAEQMVQKLNNNGFEARMEPVSR
jgi:parallel beta-helix repeat protein